MAMRPLFLLAGIGVALFLLIGYNAVYAPQQKQVRLNQARIAEEQANQQMQAEVAALLNQVERSRKRLPEEPEPSALVRDVVALAEHSGVQLTSLSRETPQEFPQFTRLTVNLQGSASYHQFGAFLDALERSERFLRVERFAISRAVAERPAAIQVAVSTLYLPPLRPAAAGSRSQ